MRGACLPTDRMLAVILILAVAETAWALLCAYTGINIFLFYGVLVLASAVFWIPGLAETGAGARRGRTEADVETKG